MADVKIASTFFTIDGFPSAAPANFSPLNVELGGRIPTLGIFHGMGPQIINPTLEHPTNPDPTEGLNCEVVFGACDGTRQWSMSAVARAGPVNQTDTHSNGRTDKCLFLSDASTLGGGGPSGSGTFKEVQFLAFTSNAVNVLQTKINNVSTPQASAAMFGGADLQVYVNVTPSLGSGAGTTTVTGVGFKPDLVIFGNYGGDFSNSSITDFGFSLGVALQDGTQMCVAWRGGTAQTVNAQMTQSLITNRASAMATIGAATLDYTCQINNFTNDGFDVVTNASASNAKLGFIAIKLNGLRAKLWNTATPAATGVQTDNTPGFSPMFGMTCQTGLTAVNTPVFNDVNGNGLVVSTFIDPYPWVISNTYRIENVRDLHNNFFAYSSMQRSLRTVIATNSELCNAINPTFTATGWTLNYITTDATPRVGWALAIERPTSQGNISQTLPSLSQAGFAFCGTSHREYRVLTGNGSFTIPNTWNNGDYKIEGISGGQPGDTPSAARLNAGDGGCGAPYGYSTHLTAGNFSVGDVLTYHAADWTNPVAARVNISDDWQGGDQSWVKKPNTSYAFQLPGGQQHYNGIVTTAPDPGFTATGFVGDSLQVGSIGGAVGSVGISTGPHVGGLGGGGVSLSGFFGGGPAGNGTFSTVDQAEIGQTEAPDPFFGPGAGWGGMGGAGFTINTDVTGTEARDGNNSGTGGITTTSAGNSGRIGSNIATINATCDSLINGGAETAQTTPFPGNWWADTSNGRGAAPGGGGTGGGGIYYPLGNLTFTTSGLSTKAALITALGNITDWGASLVGTALGAPGADGGIFGGGGAGGGNSISTNQGDMGAPGRGAPGVIVISWTPISATSDALGITDLTDAVVAQQAPDTLTLVDVTDATVVRNSQPATWLSIGGDSHDSIFPN